jgi:hypothetical protein
VVEHQIVPNSLTVSVALEEEGGVAAGEGGRQAKDGNSKYLSFLVMVVV